MQDVRLENLGKRIEKLRERIRLQKNGPEVITAKKILCRLEIEYEILKKKNGFVATESTCVAESDFLEEILIQRLGAIYWIFGSSYEQVVGFKKYRIEFVQILPNNHLNYGCLMSVQVHIYENDNPFLMDNVVLQFWKGWTDSTEVDDIGIASNDINTKYKTFHWFSPIGYNLAQTWNKYFRNVPLIEARESGLLESRSN